MTNQTDEWEANRISSIGQETLMIPMSVIGPMGVYRERDMYPVNCLRGHRYNFRH